MKLAEELEAVAQSHKTLAEELEAMRHARQERRSIARGRAEGLIKTLTPEQVHECAVRYLTLQYLRYEFVAQPTKE